MRTAFLIKDLKFEFAKTPSNGNSTIRTFLLLSSISVLNFSSIFSDAWAAPESGRNIDAEVQFTTSFNSVVPDIEQNQKSSTTFIHLAWLPLFWQFQVGPIFSSTTKESLLKSKYNDEEVDQIVTQARRGFGLKGKINLADMESSMLIPWVGGSYSRILIEQETNFTSNRRPYQINSNYESEEWISEAGATIFVNSFVGLSFSFARVVSRTREALKEAAGSWKSNESNNDPGILSLETRAQLGISTFF